MKKKKLITLLFDNYQSPKPFVLDLMFKKYLRFALIAQEELKTLTILNN
jgi:hypothetical protein